MSFGQTIWGNLLITLLMAIIPSLPILFLLIVVYLNRLHPRWMADPSNLRPATRLGWVNFIVLLLGGLLCLGLFSLPYTSLLKLAQSLSPDHQVASLNESLYQQTALFFRWLGGLSLLTSLVLIFLRHPFFAWLQRVLLWLANQSALLVTDSRAFWTDLRQGLPRSEEWFILLAITLLAAATRWVYLYKPFLHDEAYTYVGFASRSLRAVVTDYSLPNNHVFHTILVFFSTQMLGVEPWAVRLPSYLCGILCVPAAYALARKLYNPRIALLAAACVAASPDLATKSADARGYMLMALLTLLIFWLGTFVLYKTNRLAWLLIAVLSALGFYDVPTMFYPFSALLFWLFVSALVGEFDRQRSTRFRLTLNICLTGITTILLTLLLYAPILIGSGPASLIGNRFVAPMAWDDFIAIIPVHWGETWGAWSASIPLAAGIFGLGLLLSLLFNHTLTRRRVPLMLLVPLTIAAAVIVQRANPWARLWTFLLPLVLIWVCAGWGFLFEQAYRIAISGRLSQKWTSVLFAISTVGVLVGGLLVSNTFYRDGGAQPGSVEKMVTTLAQDLEPGDLVLSVSVYEPPMWYYFRRHAISWTYLDPRLQSQPKRYLIIVYGDEPETVTSILKAKKIPPDQYNLANSQLIESMDNIQVYAVPLNR